MGSNGGEVDIISNDSINGMPVELGVNAEIYQVGVWLDGFTLDAATGKVIVAEGTKGGTYTMHYELCDMNGVCKTDTIVIYVDQLPISLPNYFSPNADGVNDNFILPDALRRRVKYFNIYNRWGNIVWRSSNEYNNDFSGLHFENNNPLPDGVYYYSIELNDVRELITGFIEIMRK